MRAEMELQSGGSLYIKALTLMEFPLRAVAAFHCWHANSRRGRSQISSGKVDVLPGATRKYESMSMLEILEKFPVGLWHNSLSLGCVLLGGTPPGNLLGISASSV